MSCKKKIGLGREKSLRGERKLDHIDALGLEFSVAPKHPPPSPLVSTTHPFPPSSSPSFFQRGSSRRCGASKKSSIFPSLHFCVICFMERLLQINIIGIHRRVLSPDEALCAPGLLHFFPPPPTHFLSHHHDHRRHYHYYTTFTISSSSITTTIIAIPPPQLLADDDDDVDTASVGRSGVARAPVCGTHTGARAPVFIIRVFWNFSSGARHCFTVCHCYTPTSCQARALQQPVLYTRPSPCPQLPASSALIPRVTPVVAIATCAHIQRVSKVVRLPCPY